METCINIVMHRTPLAGSSATRLVEFREKLTELVRPEGTGPFRIVKSSGGAAGGVVSEGQGYGLLLAGVTLSTQSPGTPAYRATLSFGEELFAGWRRMCELSKGSCQDDPHLRCGGHRKRDGEAAKGFAPCLPSWAFNDDARSQRGSGSATDGDEDALLGLMLLLQSSGPEVWPLWERTLSWTYESVRAFLRFNTKASGHGEASVRLPRLGSCWGGLDCNNPSYIAPAHFRAFQQFTLRHGASFGVSNGTLREEAEAWDALVRSSYAMLDDAQCDSTGLTPNWWRPAGPVNSQGYAGCNASGTPADEFGSEAARGVWRVALDALWRPSRESARYIERVSRQLTTRLDEARGEFMPLEIDVRCAAVRSVHSDWQLNPFMFAPMSAALLVPLGASTGLATRQRKALEILSLRVASTPIDSYYSGSWIALATATLNGDFAGTCDGLFEGGCARRARRLRALGAADGSISVEEV